MAFTDAELIERARALAPGIAARSAETEALRRAAFVQADRFLGLCR